MKDIEYWLLVGRKEHRNLKGHDTRASLPEQHGLCGKHSAHGPGFSDGADEAAADFTGSGWGIGRCVLLLMVSRWHTHLELLLSSSSEIAMYLFLLGIWCCRLKVMSQAKLATLGLAHLICICVVLSKLPHFPSVVFLSVVS